MSNAPTFGMDALAPGLELWQNIVRQAAPAVPGVSNMPTGALPNLSQWVTPTFNVEELDKRIEELKTVRFWLEQNASVLGATIQALEVQKMTLSTLKGMNFSLDEVANALKITPTQAATEKAAAPAPQTPPQAADAAAAATAGAAAGTTSGTTSGATSGAIDPMQWWTALTQQFQTIAASAVPDMAGKAAAPAARKTKSKAASKATSQAVPKATSKTARPAAAAKARADTAAANTVPAGVKSKNWPLPAGRSGKAAAKRSAATSSTAATPSRGRSRA